MTLAYISPLTFRRYSTARSGLKKAALIARSISGRGKPMLSMFAIAESRSEPIVKADGSLNERSAGVTGTGDGVAGAFCEVLGPTGAGAGAEGV
jgi:hypothetical protein